MRSNTRTQITYESSQKIRNRLTELLGPPSSPCGNERPVDSGQFSVDMLKVFDSIVFDGCNNRIVVEGCESEEYYVPAGEKMTFSIATNFGRQVMKCWWIPTAGNQHMPTVNVEAGIGDQIELTIVGDADIERYPIKVLLELGEELPSRV